jgi:3-oxoadipate enol-lactonase
MTDWVDAQGISLRYELAGEGPHTLVFLHEAGGCLESWNVVTSILQRHARTLTYDSRGAGLSEKPVAPVTIDDLTRDLIGLLDALDITHPVTLVGCAVGAAVSIRTASRHPERVAALVALSPATGIAPTERARIQALAKRIETEGVRSRVLERFDHSYPPDYFTARDDREQVLARLLHADPRSYAEIYRMLCDLDLSDDLPRIRVPTLVVAGRRDGTRPPEQVEAVARAIPGARFEILDTGHAMNILTPNLVARTVERFIGAAPNPHRLPG